MTVENDGLSPVESAAHEPDGRVLPVTGSGVGVGEEFLDPANGMPQLDGATARQVAANDAAAWQAEMEAAAPPAAMPPRSMRPGAAPPPPPAAPMDPPTLRMPPATPPGAPGLPDQTTRMLPLDQVPGTTHVEGDLFDDQPDR